ncbi:MAG: DUF1361 domain-containing protein [Giesbergeria sp.]
MLKQFLIRNRYKISILALLSLASVICILLVAARIAYSDSKRYTGLVWNLFLAWIPFVLSFLAYIFSWNKRLLYFTIPLTAFLWLIFFPNAPYILTDLQHLAAETTKAPLWYDVIILVWFSWTGLLLGLVSLYLMHDIVQRTFGRISGLAVRIHHIGLEQLWGLSWKVHPLQFMGHPQRPEGSCGHHTRACHRPVQAAGGVHHFICGILFVRLPDTVFFCPHGSGAA